MRRKYYPISFITLLVLGLNLITVTCNQNNPSTNKDSIYIIENYEKYEYRIPMRDGVTLFTAVYSPKDKSKKYPIMFFRTPYSIPPYGEDKYPPYGGYYVSQFLGPSKLFTKEKFIFVYQDVRGKFMSEGEFINVRPFIENKKDSTDIDESSDVYDTIEWLLKNISNHNGKVGMWGISYPGFYTSMGIINAHPALVAASPQAPIADWFWDDFHHHGALFLPHTFNFFSVFGKPRHGLTKVWGKDFNYGTSDSYKFYLEDVGPLKNVNAKYFKDSISFWNDIVDHPNYDKFWQKRNIRPHLKKIKPAVLVVGGWYDAEDLFGVLETYKTIEKNNPKIYNILVMGPWRHGGWARDDGTILGNVFFTDNPPPSKFFQENIELSFFKYFLKGEGKLNLPEAYMFETGTNQWRKFNEWPPKNTEQKNLYLQRDGVLSFNAPLQSGNSYDEFISHPEKPVPYTETITTEMTKPYMTDDQRFASRRPDVLVYQTEILKEGVTLSGDILAKLKVSTTGTDADWIVKLIDVYPDNHPQYPHNPENIKMGGYQQMIRSEVLRGRFINSYEKPEPFIPNKIIEISLPLQDILHTFKKGHRIMIQIQSTWFSLVDRNPQKYVANIYKADEEDFITATHRVYHSKENSSFIQIKILK